MERSLFGFIIRYSKREQLMILPWVIASMLFYYATLDLPKMIVNQPIGGKGFEHADSTLPFMRWVLALPEWLGGATWTVLEGWNLERMGYLFAMTIAFLVLIIISGLIKFQINTMKGWLGERMLRRLRYALFDHILRFPLPHFRRVKAAEMATMIKDEVEPLGTFVGDSIVTPLFLGGQALTALFFIVYQHVYLGMVALGVVVVQTVIIPKLRRRLLVLAKEQQLTARQLAGRIAECVDGVTEIHANDTSNYERAEISARLGKIFLLRFELYQRKFLVKFLNNLLSQITPFLFYLIGGYLAIKGRLDIGTLVAVIAAYKDLPSPVKELIDWDQQRMDTNIKYTQVVEQFTADDLMPRAMQEPLSDPALPAQGMLRVSSLSLMDESGVKSVDGVTFETDLARHVAIVGDAGSGSGDLAQLIARLQVPTGGMVEMGGIDVVRAPEAVTGRAIAYVGPAAYLFPLSVRENLLYGLKHRPLRDAVRSGEAADGFEKRQVESTRAGNSLLDINADWVDYAAAGASGPMELEGRLLEILRAVDLEETLFEAGLRSAVDAENDRVLVENTLRARDAMREKLREASMAELVERFDPDRYNRNATLAENLLFGTPVGKGFDIDNLAKNAYVRQVLDETGLAADLLKVGHKLAETMVELFSDLPPGHEMFEQFSFISHDDLPVVKEMLAQVADVGLIGLAEEHRNMLLGLPFKLVPARHRLGLLDEALERRVLEARARFAAGLPESLRGAVEFFDPARFNSAASLQDNILFGKIASGQAEASARVGVIMRGILDELGLRPLVLKIGLDFQVGTGGSRLSAADRQKVAVGRALLRRPALLVLDQAAAVLDPAAQNRLLANVLEARRGTGVCWVLNRADVAGQFDEVLVMDRGRLVGQGAFEELKAGNSVLQRLLHLA